jgi:hypothetical protein
MTAALQLFHKLRSTAMTAKQLADGKREYGIEVWFNLDEVRELEQILTSYDAVLAALERLVNLKDNLKHAAPHEYERQKPLAWEEARKAIAKAYGEVAYG